MRFASIALALGVVFSLPIRSEAALIPTEWVTTTTAVIDFDSAPTGIFSSLIIGDFTFTWGGFSGRPRIGVIGTGNNALMDADNFSYNGSGTPVYMSLTSGGPFTVTQFDVVDAGPALPHDRVVVGGVAYAAAGTQVRGDLVNLTSLEIDVVNLAFAVDNIHVSYVRDVTPPTSVPEPATLTLVGLGALGTASWLRRRNGMGPLAAITSIERAESVRRTFRHFLKC